MRTENKKCITKIPDSGNDILLNTRRTLGGNRIDDLVFVDNNALLSAEGFDDTM